MAVQVVGASAAGAGRVSAVDAAAVVPSGAAAGGVAGVAGGGRGALTPHPSTASTSPSASRPERTIPPPSNHSPDASLPGCPPPSSPAPPPSSPDAPGQVTEGHCHVPFVHTQLVMIPPSAIVPSHAGSSACSVNGHSSESPLHDPPGTMSVAAGQSPTLLHASSAAAAAAARAAVAARRAALLRSPPIM